jgi:predicted ABC-type ATPase
LNPNVYVIAGPNGAGKTTFAREFLPAYADCRNFINADLIAQGVSPFSPDVVAFRAGRMMLEEIELYARRRDSFGFETTLAGRGHLAVIRRLKKRGYGVHFFFLWVPTVELALTRVRNRVMEGG